MQTVKRRSRVIPLLVAALFAGSVSAQYVYPSKGQSPE